MSNVILDYPTLCEPCGQALPPHEQMRDGDVIWWQMATDKPGQTKMVYYHRQCGLNLLAANGWEVCWAGCQRVIDADTERIWTDPDGDGDFSWMHSKCAGERAVVLLDIVDTIDGNRS